MILYDILTWLGLVNQFHAAGEEDIHMTVFLVSCFCKNWTLVAEGR